MQLRGTSVLVTGASSGIGRATAQELAGRDARLLLTGRDPGRLAEAAAPVAAETLAADLADPSDLDVLTAWALERSPEVIVHNAGLGLAGPADQVTEEELTRLFTVNVLAPMRLTAALLPSLRARRRGHLVFVGSIAGLLGVPQEAAYAATKAALHRYADSLRAEVSAEGIGVSTIAPGIVDTAFFERRGAPYTRRFPRPMPAHRVAVAIADAVEHDRAEVVLPRWLRLPVWLQATAPGAYHALARRFS
ncbi:MAG TPA: SDR family NAD(P)-dependent oxidoreductase [Nocardioidaceae bacterium]|nr:SDR family NAD(P)-dependent oxidoreductase [Nocardioidaceae bacterium]